MGEPERLLLREHRLHRLPEREAARLRARARVYRVPSPFFPLLIYLSKSVSRDESRNPLANGLLSIFSLVI